MRIIRCSLIIRGWTIIILCLLSSPASLTTLNISNTSIEIGGNNCRMLATLALPQAKILENAVVSSKSDDTLPATKTCKITIRIWPAPLSQSTDSFVDVYLWLPAKNHWNGRLLALGNGGYSPQIPVSQMTKYLAEGFAVAATDTGHKTETLDFVLGANERIDYWGRLAVQLLGQYSKLALNAYYQQPPNFSYFAGCSTGGHQALTAAQFYPDLYDGILAGAPGHNRVALNAAFLWLFQQSHDRSTGEQVLTKADLALLQQHVLAQCDTIDGLQDGIISAPQQCSINFAAFTCESADSQDCLNANKIARVKQLYAGPHDPITKKQIYPGFLPGTEFIDNQGWSGYWHDPAAPGQPARADFWRYWALSQQDWSPWQFDWHKDMLTAKSHLSSRIDATKTDLSAFVKYGGKLLLFHGLADPVVSATDTLSYAKAVFTNTPLAQDNLADALQLYLIPGMAHCAGGNGVNQIDFLPALINWVEQQKLPESITGYRTKSDQVIYQQTLKPTPIPN